MKRTTNSSRNLKFETLETRQLMAGNVLASVSDGVLTVTGDSANNRIVIQQLAATGAKPWPGARYSISSPPTFGDQTPTTINGENSVIVEGIKQGMKVSLGDGDDYLKIVCPGGRFLTASVPGGASIDMGSGQDAAYLHVFTQAPITVNLGGDSDRLALSGLVTDVHIQADALPIDGRITTPGNDSVQLNMVVNDLTIDTGEGDDRIDGTVQLVNGRTINVNTGPGDDSVSFHGSDNSFLSFLSFIGNVNIDTGDGNDKVSIDGTNTLYKLLISTGSGNDSVRLNSIGESQAIEVRLGEGNDRLEIVAGVTTYGGATLDGGAGSDVLIIHQNTGNRLGRKQLSGFESVRTS